MIMEAEIGMLWLKAKDSKHCQQPPEARRELEKDSSLEPLPGTHPSNTLISGL